MAYLGYYAAPVDFDDKDAVLDEVAAEMGRKRDTPPGTPRRVQIAGQRVTVDLPPMRIKPSKDYYGLGLGPESFLWRINHGHAVWLVARDMKHAETVALALIGYLLTRPAPTWGWRDFWLKYVRTMRTLPRAVLGNETVEAVHERLLATSPASYWQIAGRAWPEPSVRDVERLARKLLETVGMKEAFRYEPRQTPSGLVWWFVHY